MRCGGALRFCVAIMCVGLCVSDNKGHGGSEVMRWEGAAIYVAIYAAIYGLSAKRSRFKRHNIYIR